MRRLRGVCTDGRSEESGFGGNNAADDGSVVDRAQDIKYYGKLMTTVVYRS